MEEWMNQSINVDENAWYFGTKLLILFTDNSLSIPAENWCKLDGKFVWFKVVGLMLLVLLIPSDIQIKWNLFTVCWAVVSFSGTCYQGQPTINFVGYLSVRMTLIASKLGFSRKKNLKIPSFGKMSAQNLATQLKTLSLLISKAQICREECEKQQLVNSENKFSFPETGSVTCLFS